MDLAHERGDLSAGHAYTGHYAGFGPTFDQKWGFLSSDNMERLVGDIVHELGEGTKTVIDVGAGTGLFTLPIARKLGRGSRIHCLEPEPAMSSRIPRSNHLRKVHGSSDLFFEPGKLPTPVDAILLKESVHHIDEEKRVKTFEAMAEHLAPNGRIVVVMMKNPPSHPVPFEFRERFKKWHPAIVDINEDLRNAGLRVHAADHSYTVDMTPGEYRDLFASRYISMMSEYSDEEMKRLSGLTVRGKNKDLPHSFEHTLTFVTATKPEPDPRERERTGRVIHNAAGRLYTLGGVGVAVSGRRDRGKLRTDF